MTNTPFRPQGSPQGNIVQINHGIWDQGRDDFPACAALLRYWQDLRGTRQMPARSEFDPRGIETALAASFVAEKVSPRVARLRVAGSVLNDTLGMDVRGMPITSLFDPDVRDSVSEATRDLFAGPAMIVMELSARCGFTRRPVRARMLLLPMSDAEGNIARLVGCLDIKGGVGKSPRRFKLSALRHTRITGTAPRPIVHEPVLAPIIHHTPKAQHYAFAEDAVQFEKKPAREENASASRGGLRLVVSND